MPKYDSQLQDLVSKLASAKKILIALPVQFNTDKLSAALALGLSLKNAGKTVEVVTEGSPTVGHSNIFGVGEVKNKVPTSGEGNFIVKLDGVVDSSGQLNTVPSLEKLDWFPQGNSLNLVFHVVPGQKFQPEKVAYFHEDSGFDLTFILGVATLNELGSVESHLSGGNLINIDNTAVNSNFGTINVIDIQSSSISEMIAHILPTLGITLDQDSATNILTGIYDATSNMTQNTSQDTTQAVSQAMQAGGTVPLIASGVNQTQPVQSISFNNPPMQVSQPQQPVGQPTNFASHATDPYQQQPSFGQFNAQTQNYPQSAQPFTQPQPPVSQPANDLLNNPFLNPNQAIIQGPGFAQNPQFAGSTSSFPQAGVNLTPEVNYNQPFGQPANFGAPITDPNQQLQQPVPYNQPQYSQPAQPFTQPQQFPVSAPQMNSGVMQTQAGFNQVPQPIQPQEQPPLPVIPQSQPGDATYDLRQIFQIPQMPEEPVRQQNSPQHNLPTDNLRPQPVTPQPNAQQQTSPEETPMREMVGSPNPEMDSSPTPDWLVPKIFKSGSLS